MPQDVLEYLGVRRNDLTDWINGRHKPVRVGEYNASEFKNEGVVRFFDGHSWSCMYFADTPEPFRSMYRNQRESAAKQDQIFWRGLTARAYRRLTEKLTKESHD